MSLRAIAKQTDHHFNTVKKYVDMEDWNEARTPRRERPSALDPVKPVIDEWLTADFKRPRKYRRTATKIYKDLAEHEEYGKMLAVGKQTVINYVAKKKEEMRQNTYNTAMYGLHAPGWAQVDFGDILVAQQNGAEVTQHVLIVSFPWSNAGFAQVCRYETRECLCEALQRIFEYIGGIPLRILFDNMSSAVIQVLENGERKQTEMFMRFAMHHRFKADFCNPDSPQEKGGVEGKVKYIRNNFLLPPPQIPDVAQFNRQLLEQCTRDMARKHYLKDDTIEKLFADDMKALIPLPQERFRVFTLEKVKTDKYSFIRFENNRYSTAPKYAERTAEPCIDRENYISALSQKPRAFMNSPYFLTLPESVQTFLIACNYAHKKAFCVTYRALEYQYY
jgi:transposase